MSAPPTEIELVRSFANTLDADSGSDELATPRELTAWLVDAGLVGAGTVARRSDVEAAHRLRAAIRAELEANHDGRLADGVALARAAEGLPLRLGSEDDPLEPAAGGVAGALARIVAAVAVAKVRGSWSRLKLCGAHDCAWAYYDTSRNRSRRWCSMDVCGNRAKVRAYRARVT